MEAYNGNQVEGAWDSVEAAACGSHRRESSTGVVCEYSDSSITDIDQRICPTVVQGGRECHAGGLPFTR